MNIETREIRDVSEISEAERKTGNWVRVPGAIAKKYMQKQPVTDADYKRILAAEERRLAKKQKRLAALRRAV